MAIKQPKYRDTHFTYCTNPHAKSLKPTPKHQTNNKQTRKTPKQISMSKNGHYHQTHQNTKTTATIITNHLKIAKHQNSKYPKQHLKQQTISKPTHKYPKHKKPVASQPTAKETTAVNAPKTSKRRKTNQKPTK